MRKKNEVDTSDFGAVVSVCGGEQLLTEYRSVMTFSLITGRDRDDDARNLLQDQVECFSYRTQRQGMVTAEGDMNRSITGVRAWRTYLIETRAKTPADQHCLARACTTAHAVVWIYGSARQSFPTEHGCARSDGLVRTDRQQARDYLSGGGEALQDATTPR